MKNKTLIVVAYSYGCILMLEAIALLEKDGYTVHVILIDGSADMLKSVILQQVGDVDNLQLFETNILCAIISQFKSLDVVTKQRVSSTKQPHQYIFFTLYLQEILLQCKTFEERLNIAITDVTTIKNHSMDYLKLMVELFYKRVLALAKYTSKITELKSTIELLRPKGQSVQNIAEDYNISKIVGRNIDVKWFKGNHLSIRESEEVVGYINNWLENLK